MNRSFRRVPDTETWLEEISDVPCNSCRGCTRPAVRQLDTNFLTAADLSGHPDVITLRIADGQLWRLLWRSLGFPLAGLLAVVALTETLNVMEPVQAVMGLIGLAGGIWLARRLSPDQLRDTVEISVDE